MYLPERLKLLSLWGKWAMAVAEGKKTIETREWPWPYDPGPLVIHAGKQLDGDIQGRIDHFPNVKQPVPGSLCALVWVARCRPLVPEDAPRALVYRPGLFAWELEHIRPLFPIPFKGPRKIGHIDREIVLQSLWRANPPHFQDR
jgi:hypothetical protein